MGTPHHRRDFVRSLTLGAAATALPTTVVADNKDKPRPEKITPPSRPSSEADARMGLVLARFGAQLDEAARKAVRDEVEAITHRAEALRKFALENGDGPFPVFHPYRAPLA
jgi:hypothetical protein